MPTLLMFCVARFPVTDMARKPWMIFGPVKKFELCILDQE